jgi:HAD superfamily hydrolase (TIGR01509 family)
MATPNSCHGKSARRCERRLLLRSGLFFDLDATLVDSDAYHFAAFRVALARHGVAIDKNQYAMKIMGAAKEAIGEAFLPHLTRAERDAAIDAKEAAFRQSFAGAAPTKGLAALLDFAMANDLATAVVTNAPRANATLMLAAVGVSDRLPVVVIGEELLRAKPHPLPYLTALRLTGAEARCSIAFEDSLSGVRAAAAADLAVIGVTTGLDEATLMSAGAAFAVADFTDARIFDFIERRALEPRRNWQGETA